MAVWTTAFINKLPDSSFAFVESGGTKDEEGKTTPRTLRHLPYKDGQGNIDAPHVRNALARLSQTKISEAAKASAKKKLTTAAKEVGVEVIEAEFLQFFEVAVKEKDGFPVPSVESGWEVYDKDIYYFHHSRVSKMKGGTRQDLEVQATPKISLIAGQPENMPEGLVERYAFVFPLSEWTLQKAQEWRWNNWWIVCESAQKKEKKETEAQTPQKIETTATAGVSVEIEVSESEREFREDCTEPSSSTPIEIDEELGIIKNVAVIRPKSKNGYSYQEDALRAAIPMYEGSRVYTDHVFSQGKTEAGKEASTDKARSVNALSGKLLNVREDNDSNGFLLRGDLQLARAGNEKLFEFAQKMPEIIGLSPHSLAACIQVEGGDPEVTKIKRVFSVDVVTTPGTTKGLFEAAPENAPETTPEIKEEVKQVKENGEEKSEMDWSKITLKDLQENRSDLLEEARADLLESNHKLLKEIDDYRVKEEERKRKKFIDDELREAGIQSKDCSKVFLKQLEEAETEIAVKQLIQDRKTILSQKEPVSKEREDVFKESEQPTGDLKKDVIAAMKG